MCLTVLALLLILRVRLELILVGAILLMFLSVWWVAVLVMVDISRTGSALSAVSFWWI